VEFRYRGSNRPCLEDVSLFIEPGEVVALVGETARARAPLSSCFAECTIQPPRITFDGIDIRQFKKEDLRRAISVVFQDFSSTNSPFGITFGSATSMCRSMTIPLSDPRARRAPTLLSAS